MEQILDRMATKNSPSERVSSNCATSVASKAASECISSHENCYRNDGKVGILKINSFH